MVLYPSMNRQISDLPLVKMESTLAVRSETGSTKCQKQTHAYFGQ